MLKNGNKFNLYLYQIVHTMQLNSKNSRSPRSLTFLNINTKLALKITIYNSTFDVRNKMSTQSSSKDQRIRSSIHQTKKSVGGLKETDRSRSANACREFIDETTTRPVHQCEGGEGREEAMPRSDKGVEACKLAILSVINQPGRRDPRP